MANNSAYSRTGSVPGGGTTITTPPRGSGVTSSVPSGTPHGSRGQSSRLGGSYYSPVDWRAYAGPDGLVTTPPNYPDVSYGAYLRDGGNFLGIGYNSWRDQRLAAYNTAYNMYQQWYDSTAQQVARIGAAGLNTNLAYGMATPGSSPGGALAQSSGPSPEQVFFGGISAIAGLSSGIKALAESAQIVSELPESKLKGRIARQIDAAAKAGAINAENTYLGSLYGARNALGLGRSKAEQEQAEQAYNKAHNDASRNLLDYMTSHDSEGNESDFEGSLYARSGIASSSSEILEYQKNKLEFDKLFSNPKYFQAVLNKLVADSQISEGQAFVARTIMSSEGNSDFDKALMLQSGLPGMIFKLLGFINSEREAKKHLKPRFNADGSVIITSPSDKSNWPEGIFNH